MKFRHGSPVAPRNKCILCIPHVHVKSAFCARRLASSEVTNNEHRAARETNNALFQFQLIFTDKVVFSAVFPTCVVYTKTVIHCGE